MEVWTALCVLTFYLMFLAKLVPARSTEHVVHFQRNEPSVTAEFISCAFNPRKRFRKEKKIDHCKKRKCVEERYEILKPKAIVLESRRPRRAGFKGGGLDHCAECSAFRSFEKNCCPTLQIRQWQTDLMPLWNVNSATYTHFLI